VREREREGGARRRALGRVGRKGERKRAGRVGPGWSLGRRREEKKKKRKEKGRRGGLGRRVGKGLDRFLFFLFFSNPFQTNFKPF
jgi:hypothetical protein